MIIFSRYEPDTREAVQHVPPQGLIGVVGRIRIKELRPKDESVMNCALADMPERVTAAARRRLGLAVGTKA